MIVCFSHLRWDFVWQRPQHLMSRFGRHTPVLFVEEPEFVLADGDTALQVTTERGVTIARPRLPVSASRGTGFDSESNIQVRALIEPLVTSLAGAARAGTPRVLWYYTPLALGAEPGGFKPDMVVFDAMDELSAFRGAPATLVRQEAALLSRVDLVFAGGPSLYEARRGRHSSVHCFPSGVETEHFARAMNGIPRPAELAGRPRPILGYYGVIDERVDLDLIASIAEQRPAWTIAMVGPVAKIQSEDLPRRSNILYFGKQEYSALPGYLACFDVAMLPFALNEATRFISPTKTLEYLAAGKPVVSTPISDVVFLYGSAVAIADSAEAMIAATERALAETQAESADRRRRAAPLVASAHWDSIADRMWQLIAARARSVQPRRPVAAR